MSNDQAKRLKLLRKISGLTITQLSTKYTISESTIKYWESESGGKLSKKGAHKIIDAMRQEGIQCNLNWLLQGVGPYPQLLDIRHGTPLPLNSNISEEMEINREIDFFCQQNRNAITVALIDDSLEPLYLMHDTVGGILLVENAIKQVIGKICIVKTKDNQTLVKKVLPGSTQEVYNLFSINPHSSINPPILTDIEIISAAPISRIWKRV